ncbi:hypothetical protein [Acetobacter pomorum]|nr:hypothetical protein [Acetobacter pomorum]
MPNQNSVTLTLLPRVVNRYLAHGLVAGNAGLLLRGLRAEGAEPMFKAGL